MNRGPNARCCYLLLYTFDMEGHGIGQVFVSEQLVDGWQLQQSSCLPASQVFLCKNNATKKLNIIIKQKLPNMSEGIMLVQPLDAMDKARCSGMAATDS